MTRPDAQLPAGGIVNEVTNTGEAMAETTETEAPVEDVNERAKVEGWRLHILIEAGFPLHLAERLAASEADLHTCVDLVRSGCDPTMAAEILL